MKQVWYLPTVDDSDRPLVVKVRVIGERDGFRMIRQFGGHEDIIVHVRHLTQDWIVAWMKAKKTRRKMTAISKLHATCAHLDTHWTFASFAKNERTEVEKESDFIYFIAKLKAFEYLRRRSQKQAFRYEDFVNAEAKFYKEEIDFRKGVINGKEEMK